MKKWMLAILFMWGSLSGNAQTISADLLSLLRQPYRTAAQTEQVLRIFRNTSDVNTLFATGTNLVRIAPPPSAAPALLNPIVQGTDPLKSAWAAIIITSMGAVYEELTPLLAQARESQDPILRAYGAGAYALVHPEDKTQTNDITYLFSLDEQLAQRAMNLVATTPSEQLSFLKKAAADPDPETRAAAAAWLGTLHSKEAVKILLQCAKKEIIPTVQTQLATALAKTPDLSLTDVAKGLKTKYTKETSATYALALGFMTGNGIDTLKTSLSSKNQNQRINALRAAAYMAGVLSTPDAFTYSTERTFDTHLLKGLIAPISGLAQQGTEKEKTYAQHALVQIEKLL